MIDKKGLKFVKYGDIRVYYLPRLDGGGTGFGQDYIPIVRERFKKVGRICEFCSGPGFIGFSLLANGLCDSLCLVEVNPDAVEVCRYTIEANGLQDRVNVYLSDGLAGVPKGERWDLVVSNPPHFDGSEKLYDMDMIAIDPGWRIHREFYKSVPQFLAKGGSVLFVENEVGSSADQWGELAEKNGLRVVGSFKYANTSQGRNHILNVFIDRMAYSVRDRSFFSHGPSFYIHNMKKFFRNTYKPDKFYYFWSKKE